MPPKTGQRPIIFNQLTGSRHPDPYPPGTGKSPEFVVPLPGTYFRPRPNHPRIPAIEDAGHPPRGRRCHVFDKRDPKGYITLPKNGYACRPPMKRHESGGLGLLNTSTPGLGQTRFGEPNGSNSSTVFMTFPFGSNRTLPRPAAGLASDNEGCLIFRSPSRYNFIATIFRITPAPCSPCEPTRPNRASKSRMNGHSGWQRTSFLFCDPRIATWVCRRPSS